MRGKWKKLINGTATTFLYLFAWEMFEELVEEGIALGLTTLLTKTISIVFVISATQGLKITIKRIIKSITYKEGNDKMKLIKNYLTLIWGNKITGATSGILAAGLVYYQAALPEYAGIAWIAIVAFIVFYNFAALLGGEYLYQILDRVAKANLKKEEYARIKAEEARIREIAKAKEFLAKVDEARKLVDQEVQKTE